MKDRVLECFLLSQSCARVITGIGTGQLNALVPVWTSELSHHSGRGAAMGLELMLNIAGLATAYWIEFGLRGANQELRWRLPLALQVGFLLVLLFLVPLFPESPRWLAKMGRDEDAREILSVLRHHNGDSPEELSGRVELELQGILETVQEERKHEENEQGAITIGLCCFVMIPNIYVVGHVYAPTVFQQAGYSELSGINNISYTLSVIVAIVTLDRIGRRVTLYWGAIVMGISLLICGIAARYVADISLSSDERQSWGNVVTAFIFIYTATFGATWLTVPWLVPTEIMPLYARAKGGCWSVVGWSIGNGIVTEIAPFLFNAITHWTFILFSAINFFTLPNVYFLLPETAGRSLEDMNILFESDRIFVHKAKYIDRPIKRIDLDDPSVVAAHPEALA
ncbi:hypothetical protein MJO29_004862 [Puccinia striiformis f. sp. tritici]|nr:hypothetical protein MJO29_004862 [Puccinia striiformis f. sp. tritici]